MINIFKGQIGRGQYWSLMGIFVLAFVAAIVLVLSTVNKTGLWTFVAVVIGVFLFFATCVALLGAGVRRLHDRGKSGFWIVPYYVAPAILAVLSIDPEGSGFVPECIAIVILVWAIIDLGFLEAAEAAVA
jgi:uncharacterized membrane protein YhaH (DUF805 family)